LQPIDPSDMMTAGASAMGAPVVSTMQLHAHRSVCFMPKKSHVGVLTVCPVDGL